MTKKQSKQKSEPTVPTRPKPWQRRRPRPTRPDTVVVGGQPIMEITIYPKLVMVTKRERGAWTSYPVAPEALAQQLAGVPVTSGLLPPGAIAAGRLGGQPFLAVLDAARVVTLATPQRAYPIPIPPLVFTGCGHEYRVWALASDVLSTSSRLCVAPFPNCYNDGRICWGNVSLPQAGADIRSVLKLFLEESFFNAHVANGKSKQYPNSVLAQWDALAREQAPSYPLDDLVATTLTLDWLCRGGPWN